MVRPDGARRVDQGMSLVELGRYDRNLANIIVARLESDGIPALASTAPRRSPTAAGCSSRCA
jgi:hypothetical protein